MCKKILHSAGLFLVLTVFFSINSSALTVKSSKKSANNQKQSERTTGSNEWIVLQKKSLDRVNRGLLRFKSSLKRSEKGAVSFTVLKKLSITSKKLLLKRFSSSNISFERNQVASIADGVGENYSSGGQQIPWGVERIGATKVWSNDPASRGAGIKVAVIDTGVASSHSDLLGKVKEGLNVLTPGGTCEDDHGHGSHVAGIIAANHNQIGVAGVAPDSEIYCVKVLDSRGSGRIDGVASGINWAISKGVNVINLSLGFRDASYTVEGALKAAYSAGIVTVVSAGNGGIRGTLYPAKYPEVISVGAIGKDGLLAEFSANGRETTDVAAPGVAIPSTVLNGSYASWSGTSMAAPHITGSVALIMAKANFCNSNGVRSCSPHEIESKIKQFSTGTLLSSGYGYGEINLATILGAGGTTTGDQTTIEDQTNIQPPKITGESLPPFAIAGAEAKFTVNASGENLKYSWFINGKIAQSSNSNLFIINNVSFLLDGAEIYALVKNEAGEARSSKITLKVF